MTQQEILEYNKKCAEFLGWKNLNDDSFPEYVNPLGDFYQLKELKFHSDWNWIMDMVEGIEKKGYEIDIFSNCVEICDIPDENYITEAVGKTKKEAVVGAINQFLIWYEQNK